ncbi:hypothetical protein BASA81_013811 [Batrachochytrium salamandrivorans]|nr:hypothetical protein BASA81_013811 [Batrachochytrium salamandrivorans]
MSSTAIPAAAGGDPQSSSLLHAKPLLSTTTPAPMDENGPRLGLILTDSLWFEFCMVLLILLFIAITVAECSTTSDTILPYGLGVTSAVLLAVLGGEVIIVRAWLFRGNFRKRHLLGLVLACTAFGLQVAVLVPPSITPAVLVSSRVFSLLVSMYSVKRVSDFVLTSQVWLNSKHRNDHLTTLERCLQVLKDFETKHLISETDRASMQWLTMTIASHRLYQDTDKQHGPSFYGADEDTSKWLRGTYTQHQAVATPTNENAPLGGPEEEDTPIVVTKSLPKVGSGVGSTFSTNSAVKSKLSRSASMPPHPPIAPRRNSSMDGGDSVVGNYVEGIDLSSAGGSGKDQARIVTGTLFGLTTQDLLLLKRMDGEEEEEAIVFDVDKLNREMDEWEFDAFAVHDRYPLSLCLLSSLRKNLSLDSLGIPTLPPPDKLHDHLGAWWPDFEQQTTHSASFNATTQGFTLPVTAYPLEYRRLILKTALHCADVSNPARPLNLAIKLAELVQEEFFLQGDLEKQHKLPVSLFMDRDRPAFPKMQVGFIEFIVKPLLDTYLMWLKPYKGSADIHLAANLEYWKKRAEQESSTTTAVASSPLLPPRSVKNSRHRPQGSMGEEMPFKRTPNGMGHRRTNSEHNSRSFISAMVAAATAPPSPAPDTLSPKPSRADTLV